MEIKLEGDCSNILDGIKELQTSFGFTINQKAEISLVCEKKESDHDLSVTYKYHIGNITYHKPNQFYRAFGLFLEKVQKGETDFSIKEKAQFKTIGPMFDFSRNAVMKPERFYEMVRILAVMGFDSAML